MANNIDAKLNKWAALAGDDIDLRTEEGVQEAAKQLSSFKNIPFADALAEIRSKVAKRQAVCGKRCGQVTLTPFTLDSF